MKELRRSYRTVREQCSSGKIEQPWLPVKYITG